jgi:hypothetical protein
MKKMVLSLMVGFSSVYCSANANDVEGKHFKEFLDASLPGSQIDCGKTNELVGRAFEIKGASHDVEGTVRVIDDCTLLISKFDFDGLGRLVEIYVGVDGNFSEGSPISVDLFRPTKPYEHAEVLVRLPQGTLLESFNSLSVWCTEFNVSFGEAILL